MSFNSDIQRFSKKTGIALDVAVRKIVFDAFNMVVKKTPVDTGRARGNWIVSVNSIDRTVKLDATRPNAISIKKGDGVNPIYITNSLDYIHDLESGTSKQARSGMVAVTINEIRGSF
jgi:hypothetical protein